jgi:SAM-dependent methyltransferase
MNAARPHTLRTRKPCKPRYAFELDLSPRLRAWKHHGSSRTLRKQQKSPLLRRFRGRKRRSSAKPVDPVFPEHGRATLLGDEADLLAGHYPRGDEHPRVRLRRGLQRRVTGLDATPLFLDRARRDAAARNVEVDYVDGDMRSLPWADARFDRVLSWFTSFGYFNDDDNRRVLREAHRVLRPHGRLLIENNNLAELLPRWLPAVVTERDGDFAIDRPRFDPVTGRATTERVLVRDGNVRRCSFSVRMFIVVELRDWLLDVGFGVVNLLDGTGDALTAHSRRMITIAHR